MYHFDTDSALLNNFAQYLTIALFAGIARFAACCHHQVTTTQWCYYRATDGLDPRIASSFRGGC